MPKRCENCGGSRGPNLTVDAILSNREKTEILLVYRKHEPIGWALPGGFVDKGEDLISAVKRELMEETGCGMEDIQCLGFADDPNRDPREHNISVLFTGLRVGSPKAADDAEQAVVFDVNKLPINIVFDHEGIIEAWKNS